MTHGIWARRPAVVACLALAALLLTSVVPVNGASWQGRYSIWRNRAYVTQYLDFSCVGATVQITVNLINNRRDRSRRNQLTYLDYAQQNSRYPVADLGADPEGWARALVHWGAGDDYGWSTAPTIQASLKTAARQLRTTNKPIGLLTFHGGHAWLMTGFEASADPALTNDFTVTAAEVLGPLWPNGTYNGRSADPGPRTWMSVSTLGRRFNPYYQRNQSIWNGQWVTIIPQASQASPAVEPGSASQQQELPDLNSAAGWIWALNRLSLRTAVRDLIWLP